MKRSERRDSSITLIPNTNSSTLSPIRNIAIYNLILLILHPTFTRTTPPSPTT